jgi:hypothetical protein
MLYSKAATRLWLGLAVLLSSYQQPTSAVCFAIYRSPLMRANYAIATTLRFLTLLLGSGALLGCREPEGGEQNVRAQTEGEVIPVSSDARATYHLLDWSQLPNGNREALTSREGPSGTSFARREIDCDRMMFRYLGEGDTRAEAEADAPNPGNMAELVPGSISTEVSEYVCGK